MKKALHIFSSVVVFLIVVVMLLIVGVRIVGIDPYNYLDGSIIYVKPTADYSQIKAGDTITYVLNENNNITTNEVYSINTEKRFFYIRSSELLYVGDSKRNDSALNVDGIAVVPVSFDSLIGKVIAVVPYMGYVSDFLAQRTGFTIILAVMAFFLIMLVVTMPKRNRKNKLKAKPVSEAQSADEDNTSDTPIVEVPEEDIKVIPTASENTDAAQAVSAENITADTEIPQKKYSRTINLSAEMAKDAGKKSKTLTAENDMPTKKYSRITVKDSKK